MKKILLIGLLSISLFGNEYTKSTYNPTTIEIIISLIGLLIIIGLIVKTVILEPIKRSKIKKKNKESKQENKIVNRILKNKYDIDFKGEYTLNIYDFIKNNVEKLTNNKATYYNFKKDELLEYINLNEAYNDSIEFNRKDHLFRDKTAEEIDYIIKKSLIEIKHNLYQKGVYFPLYNLDNFDGEYKEVKEESMDITIEDYKDQIKDGEYTIDGLVIIFWIVVIFSAVISFFYTLKLGLFIVITLSIINFYDALKAKVKIEKLQQELWTFLWAKDSYSVPNL